MNRSAPEPASTVPPWRALGLLALLVFAAHAMLLRTSPQDFGASMDTSKQQTRVFATRTIEAPKTAAVAPAAAPAAKPKRKPAAAPARPETSSEPPPAINESTEPVQASATSVATADAAQAPASAPEASPAAEAPAQPASAASAMAAAPPSRPALTPVGAMVLPASVRLEYKMTGASKGLDYFANGELAWQNDGSHYDARMTVSALFIGSRTMASRGQINAQGLAPTRFSDKSRNELAAHFDTEREQITFSANTPTAPWFKGAQDRLSVSLQLGGMLAGNPSAFPVGTTISVYTVGPRDADVWTFRVESMEALQLPFGELPAIKLIRMPRREFDQTAEIWFAPTLGYLPVRSKITQHSGDFVDQQLKAINKP